MKKTPDMRELLDRYWEGETTLEEERRIKAFFASADDNLPEEFRQEARWFRILQLEQAVEAPGLRRTEPAIRSLWWHGLAAAIIAVLCAIGAWWQSYPPKQTESVVQQPVEQIDLSNPRTRQVAVPQVSAPQPAQVVAVQVKIKKPARSKKQAPATLEVDTCDDPEKALAEIKAALALVSTKINKSKETLDKGLQEVDHIDILLKRKNG